MSERVEHSVEVLPIGHTLSVPHGEAIMVVALANGWRWPNVCGGEAACGVCVLEVLQGMENASPIGRDEALRLTVIRKADKPDARLACQLRVSGPMRVLKRGARPLAGQAEQSHEENAG
jgi:ferredoxin, 2Fe-2S